MFAEDLGKFQRLLRILNLLSNPSGVSIRRLTDETGRDARTIYRDLDELRDACFDIEQVRPRGPYRLSREYTGLAQTLTLEEVLCLGLSSCLLQKQLGGVGRDAMRKLFNFVKGDKRDKASQLPEVLQVHGGEEHPWIPQIMQALSQRKRIRFHYSKGEQPTRTVEPYTLFYQNERWYLQGLDQFRQDLRSFRLARIESLEVLDQHFRIPDAYSAESAKFHKWDIAPGDPIPIQCQVDHDLARWFTENPVHPSQTVAHNIVHLQVRDLDALAHWLLSLRNIKVLSPPQLQKLVREKAQQILQNH